MGRGKEGMLLNWVTIRQFASVGRLLVALTLVFICLPLAPLWAQDQSGISSPATGSAVAGDVPIFGTAVIDPFQKYELHYKQEPSGDDAYIYFGGGTSPVVNGQLGVWQAGGLPPGVYSIRLRVVKADGNYAEFFAQNLSMNVSVEPTPTPTSDEPTPTPIPTETFTPAPQPTPAVGAVQQPQVEGEQPPTPTLAAAIVDLSLTPTPEGQSGEAAGEVALVAPGVTSVAAANDESGLTRELGEALAFEKLQRQFWNGVRYSAVIFLGVFALFGGKRLFDWAWTQFR